MASTAQLCLPYVVGILDMRKEIGALNVNRL
jgi:hypothetical protein